MVTLHKENQNQKRTVNLIRRMRRQNFLRKLIPDTYIASRVSVKDISRRIVFNAKHARKTVISQKTVEHFPIATREFI